MSYWSLNAFVFFTAISSSESTIAHRPRARRFATTPFMYSSCLTTKGLLPPPEKMSGRCWMSWLIDASTSAWKLGLSNGQLDPEPLPGGSEHEPPDGGGCGAGVGPVCGGLGAGLLGGAGACVGGGAVGI